MVLVLALAAALTALPPFQAAPPQAPPAQAPASPAVQVPAAGPPAVTLPAALIGFWESEATSRGGLGTALRINADGTCGSTVTVKTAFTYAFEHGTLTFAAGADGTPPATLAVTLTGDTLVATPSAGGPATKTRVGAQADPGRPIVGVWRYAHPTGAIAWERYLPDGTMEFRMPASERPARCTVSGDRLAITSPGMTTDARYELKNGKLLLFGAAGEARVFAPVAGGRWYGRAEAAPAIK